MKHRHRSNSKRRGIQPIRTSVRPSNSLNTTMQQSTHFSSKSDGDGIHRHHYQIKSISSIHFDQNKTLSSLNQHQMSKSGKRTPAIATKLNNDQKQQSTTMEESRSATELKYKRKSGTYPCQQCPCLKIIFAVFLGLVLISSITAALLAFLSKSQTTASTSVTSASSSITTTTTTTETTTVGILSIGLNDTLQGLWNTVAGDNCTFASPGTGSGNYVAAEPPSNAFDGNCSSKYTSFGACSSSTSPGTSTCAIDTGVHVILQQGPTVVKALRFCTGNDVPARDPLTMTLEGSNQTGSVLFFELSWTLIYNGSTGLDVDPGRHSYGVSTTLSSNTIAYKSYRILLTSKRGVDKALQYSEIELFT